MISISQVNKTLNADTNKLSELCTHESINKWSFKKPLDINKNKIDDIDIYQADCGFDFNNITTTKIAEVINNAGKFTWVYKRPTCCYRLGDFDGYNHSELPWFQSEFNNGSTTITQSTAYNLTILFNGDMTKITQLDTFKTLDFCLLLWGSDTKVYKCATMEDMQDLTKVSITANLLYPGVYSLMPVLTNSTSALPNTFVNIDNTALNTYYQMECNTLRANITAPPAPAKIEITNFEVICELQQSEYVIYSISFNVEGGDITPWFEITVGYGEVKQYYPDVSSSDGVYQLKQEITTTDALCKMHYIDTDGTEKAYNFNLDKWIN